MCDEDIVKLYQLRDETALSVTQEVYGSYLYKIAYNILSDRQDSDESVNDTYLAAWNSIPPHLPAVLSTYLGKLARRISIDRFRRKHRQKRIGSEYATSITELEGILSSPQSPEELAEVKLLAEYINRFLQTLPKETRRVFIGRYYFLDPVKDIAAYCGISEGKTKTVLHRTREKLKSFLQKEGFSL